jgi:hypothetical protein
MSSFIEEKYFPTLDVFSSIVNVICPTCPTRRCEECIFFLELDLQREILMRKTAQEYFH